MIYLILKIFVYLLLALLAGGAAGWILRHLAATRQDEETQRTLADARARVPQFESLIRSRDEQINRLKEDLKDKDTRINGLVEDVRNAESSFRDKDRELKSLIAQNETLDLADEGSAAVESGLLDDDTLDFGGESSGDEQRLRAEVQRLEQALVKARAEAADALAEAAAAEAEVITLKAALGRAGSESRASASASVDGPQTAAADNLEIQELGARLQQKAEEFERLSRDLELEQRRVVELERERALQNKSLQVLHQQLELERERGQRAANG